MDSRNEMFRFVAATSPGEQETRAIKSNNVARTCNRLSQFIKERRSFGDVGFSSIVSPRIEMKGTEEVLLCATPRDSEIVVKKSLDLFPLTSCSSPDGGFGEFNKNTAQTRNLPNLNEAKKTTGSMTIIYEGKVVVFDDLQEEMAQQIISLASKHETNGRNKNTITSTSNNLTHALSHLPIQRGASLHRFMEKRKDRISARSPYQLSKSSSRTQLQEEHQLELKLG